MQQAQNQQNKGYSNTTVGSKTNQIKGANSQVGSKANGVGGLSKMQSLNGSKRVPLGNSQNVINVIKNSTPTKNEG